jgi:hypothetical protein
MRGLGQLEYLILFAEVEPVSRNVINLILGTGYQQFPFQSSCPHLPSKTKEMLSQDVKQFNCPSQLYDYNTCEASSWSVSFESDENCLE